MRTLRIAFAFVLCLVAASAFAEDWFDVYDVGVTAAQRGDWATVKTQMTRSIALKPQEELEARAKSTIVVYVPHFWLGLAKISLGDPDGGLKELAVSEQQGVIQKTRYAGDLAAWKTRGQAQKTKASQDAVSGDRKIAEAAINRALGGQVTAVSSGGERTASYVTAQKSLKQAIDILNRGGTDAKAFQQATQLANEANGLFGKAVEEGKAAKAAAKAAATPPPATESDDAPVLQVETETRVSARIELQTLKRKLDEAKSAKGADAAFKSWLQSSVADVATWDTTLRTTKDDASAAQVLASVNARRQELDSRLALVAVAAAPAPVVPVVPANVKRGPLDPKVLDSLKKAWSAYSSGDITGSEKTLDALIANDPSAGESFLLRGCVRYTRAMFEKDSIQLLGQAASDFSTALALDDSLRLDESRFSPKLVAFFGDVRKRMAN